MRYKSKNDGLFDFVLLLILALLGYNFYADWQQDGEIMWSVQLFVIISTVIILWMYVDLSYTLDDEYLKYRSGPVRGKIKTADIRKISRGKTMLSGLKIARARKGLIVHYGKYDAIYISPEREKEFIEELLSYNPNIQIE